MAKQHHLFILRQSVSNWNFTREPRPDVVPGLSGAGLKSACFPFAPRQWVRGAETGRRGMNVAASGFREAAAAGACLSEAGLASPGLAFDQATLAGAGLNATGASGADPHGARRRDAAGADVAEASLAGVAVFNAGLTHANPDKSRTAPAGPDGATLAGSTFSRASRAQAHLSWAGANAGAKTGLLAHLGF